MVFAGPSPTLPPAPRSALGRDGVAAVAVAWSGIRAQGPEPKSSAATRAGDGARANDSCLLAKVVATEKRCWAASCRDDGELL